jgi:signal transduction histidine kinase
MRATFVDITARRQAAQDLRQLNASLAWANDQLELSVVGRIVTDLRPSILDHQGLWASLEWQAHEFA